jgi:hypothetical protein
VGDGCSVGDDWYVGDGFGSVDWYVGDSGWYVGAGCSVGDWFGSVDWYVGGVSAGCTVGGVGSFANNV